MEFNLPEATLIRVHIRDLDGRDVHTLAEREFERGSHTLRWDCQNGSGMAVRPGIYFLEMSSPTGVVGVKLIVR